MFFGDEKNKKRCKKKNENRGAKENIILLTFLNPIIYV